MRILLITIMVVASSLAVVSQQTYYVSLAGKGDKEGKSWENASDDLINMLNKAQSGDAVWVSEGIYTGGFFMKEGVSVYGGFSGSEDHLNERKMPGTGENLTILDGNFCYQVLTQRSIFNTPTVWDGFVIQNGTSQMGGGVYLQKNGILRRCIIKGNSTSLPSVGEYIMQEGGVVFKIDKKSMKVWVIAEEDCGRNYQVYHAANTLVDTIEDAILDIDGKINTAMLTKSRASQAIQAYRGGNKSGWYIPSAGEWATFLELQKDGGFTKTNIYDLVESSLTTNGKAPLSGRKYWSSTHTKHSEMPAAWHINFETEDIQKINIWQYNLIRGVRYYNYNSTPETGKGGGVYALEGSRIEGCLVTENQASGGSGIYARGAVVILNSTVINNKLESSDIFSSAIDGNSAVKVYNTIKAGNLLSSGGLDKQTDASYYAYSAIETSNIESGESNILLKDVAEVGFIDITSNDYKLSSSSSLAEAGNITYIPLELDTDLGDRARISNNNVSIGAYQHGYVSGLSESISGNIHIYPNPVKAGENILFDLRMLDIKIIAEIHDISGKIIISKEINSSDKVLAPKTPGTYILKLTHETQPIFEYKLIVN